MVKTTWAAKAYTSKLNLEISKSEWNSSLNFYELWLSMGIGDGIDNDFKRRRGGVG